MKLRSTTPASKSIVSAKWFAVAIVLTISMVAGLYVTNPASANPYESKIRALQADMARYQAEADRLNSEATSLKNTLAQIANSKNALQSQINLTQTQYDQLVGEIKVTEEKIADNQDALGGILADLYVDDEISPIEMLASSRSIDDFINKQEYRNAVKEELGTTIKTVKDLKVALEEKKAEVERVLAEQQRARESLVAKEAEQQRLLQRTNNDEAGYQNLIASSEEQIAHVRAAQAALRARTASTGGYTLVGSGSLSGYNWNEATCPMLGYLSTGGVDGNGGDGYGYGCRQCASYVAWKVAQVTGRYYSWGNGGDFGRNAVAAGYQNLGRSPQPGSLAVLWGNPGHVAWVETVSADGGSVLVSQYNYNYGAGWGMYSEMWLSTSFFDQYVKI
ncbi:hypothetical protein B7Y94_03360 [Candidatus Saccharibacteria bacterium 32-49-12]|nr:MAG: hypothetical protein B7Y94_03360 [Candidatus Saccharibacteria bacterium 32-49-12]